MEILANEIRPNTLKDVLGQKHLVGKDKILYNLVKNKKLFSMILYGSPGIGKTTLAFALVNELKMDYVCLNAVINTKKDFDEAIYEAKLKGNLIIIMDEIHRLNKDKQDLLLPYLENGLIILIGLTTSNPFHSINPAIRSRCQLFELFPLNEEDIITGIKRATKKLKDIKIDKQSIKYIASLANGDLRFAYNLLEISYYSSNDYKINIDLIKQINSHPNIYYDKNDDGYYDTISALQKSIRGSDVDAAIYYLGKLINAGDLDIIFRRLSVIAYEDIGLANTSMGVKVNACISACERLGLPEARIPLSVLVIEMALSPKSNSAYSALDKALGDIETINTGVVPNHLKTNSKDYIYPHNYKGSVVKQQYLPDEIKSKRYYIPKDNNFEKQLKKVNDKIKDILN